MNRKKPEPKKALGDVLVQIILPIAAFVGGAALFGFNLAVGVATKPYVDERFTEAHRYTDTVAAQTLKEAFEHSDTNRQAMMIEFQKMNGEREKTEATLSTKVDLMLRVVQEMRDAAYARDTKRQSR